MLITTTEKRLLRDDHREEKGDSTLRKVRFVLLVSRTDLTVGGAGAHAGAVLIAGRPRISSPKIATCTCTATATLGSNHEVASEPYPH
jgi:hypothetical protein